MLCPPFMCVYNSCSFIFNRLRITPCAQWNKCVSKRIGDHRGRDVTRLHDCDFYSQKIKIRVAMHEKRLLQFAKANRFRYNIICRRFYCKII